MLESLNKDIQIDKYNLDALCEKQASLYFYYSELQSKEESVLSELKLTLKEEESRADLHFRMNGLPDGVKITESGISSAISGLGMIEALRRKVIKQQEIVINLENAVRALDQKRKMLELLVQLYVHNYYCTDQNVGEAIQKLKTENINTDRMKKKE